MSAFDLVKEATVTNGHGEVNFLRIDAGSVDLSDFEKIEPSDLGYVVGHSESGHHHVLGREGVTLYRSKGMDILYAILDEPIRLHQSASNPHEEQIVEAGVHLITINIEFDPFLQQARRVAD